MSRVTVDIVLDVVAAHYGVFRSALVRQSQAAEHVDARHIVWWLAARVGGLPHRHVAHRMGREHSTLLYGLRKVDRRLKVDGDFAALIQALSDRVLEAAGAPAQHERAEPASLDGPQMPRRMQAASAGLWTQPKARRATQRHLARALAQLDAIAALWADEDDEAVRLVEAARGHIEALGAGLADQWSRDGSAGRASQHGSPAAGVGARHG